MRAAILRKPKSNLEIEERAIPTPGPGEVLVRVRACGVCHGDLMVRNGEFPFVRFPIVPGHEVVGVVETLGSGVTHPRRAHALECRGFILLAATANTALMATMSSVPTGSTSE